MCVLLPQPATSLLPPSPKAPQQSAVPKEPPLQSPITVASADSWWSGLWHLASNSALKLQVRCARSFSRAPGNLSVCSQPGSPEEEARGARCPGKDERRLLRFATVRRGGGVCGEMLSLIPGPGTAVAAPSRAARSIHLSVLGPNAALPPAAPLIDAELGGSRLEALLQQHGSDEGNAFVCAAAPRCPHNLPCNDTSELRPGAEASKIYLEGSRKCPINCWSWHL